MNDDLQDLPAFGAAQTAGGTVSDHDLPPDPEGAKQMATVRRRPPSTCPDGYLIPLPAAQDGLLANDLIVLVSTLEQDRVRLTASGRGSDSAAVMEIAGRMLEGVITLVRRHLTLETSGATLTDVLAEAWELCDAIEALRKEFEGSTVRAVLSFFRKSGISRSQRRELFRLLLDRVQEVLERVFVLFKARFESPVSAVEWTQTYTVYLAELNQVMSALDCS